MSMLSKLFCLSASSKSATLEDREKLALAPALMVPFLKNLAKEADTGFLYLSTCHRVEVYGHGADPSLVTKLWTEATDTRPEAIRCLRDAAALEHFSRVAAGLESEILGENQIMGQVRSSLREAKENCLLTSPLNHMLQRGLRVARNIRNESRVGEGRENLSDLAITTLHEVFESLNDKSFLIVGAGTMSLLALERLKSLKVSKITWINRSRDKIEAHPYARFCKIEDFSNIAQLVNTHDVNFLATAAQHPILSKEILEKASLNFKKTRMANLKVILDLGLPRNAAPDLSELGFILRNVDDFKEILDDQDAFQKERVEFADKVLKRDLEEIKRDFDLETIAPLKRDFLGKWKWLADEILLENSANRVYNTERFWAKLGHVLMTKANELGPYEGGQFLKYLCEGLDSFEVNETSRSNNASEQKPQNTTPTQENENNFVNVLPIRER
ncbi:MAG: hypothetical protein R3A80_12940 [Bdellovibrionota bacterium]